MTDWDCPPMGVIKMPGVITGLGVVNKRLVVLTTDGLYVYGQSDLTDKGLSLSAKVRTRVLGYLYRFEKWIQRK